MTSWASSSPAREPRSGRLANTTVIWRSSASHSSWPGTIKASMARGGEGGTRAAGTSTGWRGGRGGRGRGGGAGRGGGRRRAGQAPLEQVEGGRRERHQPRLGPLGGPGRL